MAPKDKLPDGSPKKISHRSPLTSKQQKEMAELFDSSDEIDKLLRSVADVASKSRGGLILLAKLAIESTATLNEIASASTDQTRSVATKLGYWPVLASSHTHRLNEIRDFLKSLHLGRNFLEPVDEGQRYSKESVARKWAIQILEQIEQHRKPRSATLDDFVDSLILPRLTLSAPYSLRDHNNAHLEMPLREREQLVNELATNSEARRRVELVESFIRNFELASKALPPLTTATSKQWMKVIRFYLDFFFDLAGPEVFPQLECLGRHKAASRGYGPEHPPYKKLVIGGIYQAIEAALKRLIPRGGRTSDPQIKK